MGFFDDLESEVARPTGDDLERPTDLGDYSIVVAKLREGWVHRIHRMKPGQDKTKPRQFQEVEVAWDARKGKFTWRMSLAETAGRRRGRTIDEDVRLFDEQGLIDAFGESPWIGHAALDALGVDRSRPEF